MKHTNGMPPSGLPAELGERGDSPPGIWEDRVSLPWEVRKGALSWSPSQSLIEGLSVSGSILSASYKLSLIPHQPA